MPPIALVITVLLLVLVIIYTTRPFFTTRSESETTPPEDNAAPEDAYQAVLEHIRELDFEYKMGKMSQQEHEEQRAPLVQKAADALRDLRSADSTSVPPDGDPKE